MTDPLPIDESRDLKDCEPVLRLRYEAMRLEFESTTKMQLFPTCTYRSVKKQQELYKVGRRGIAGEEVLTQLDGINKKSNHNFYPARAIDSCVDIDPGPGKHIVWNPEAYALLGPLCKKYNLVWGGYFTTVKNGKVVPFHDDQHIELSKQI